MTFADDLALVLIEMVTVATVLFMVIYILHKNIGYRRNKNQVPRSRRAKASAMK